MVYMCTFTKNFTLFNDIDMSTPSYYQHIVTPLAQYGHSYSDIHRAVQAVYPDVNYSAVRRLVMKIRSRMIEKAERSRHRKGVFSMTDMKNITEEVCSDLLNWCKE